MLLPVVITRLTREAGEDMQACCPSGTPSPQKESDRLRIIPTFGKVISATPTPITDQFRCHDSLSAQKRKPNQP
ncbi:hypothetical protein E2C01_007956 [Portunus trituberculatus]|uniref:Uncharacterized protein n=1 Tax=Portunus trituberculatus TaxID=210409 RepID=A0A5B7CZI2_PORTR|nr:hypothetical protein [Portunus trituberculatus]